MGWQVALGIATWLAGGLPETFRYVVPKLCGWQVHMGLLRHLTLWAGESVCCGAIWEADEFLTYLAMRAI